MRVHCTGGYKNSVAFKSRLVIYATLKEIVDC